MLKVHGSCKAKSTRRWLLVHTCGTATPGDPQLCATREPPRVPTLTRRSPGRVLCSQPCPQDRLCLSGWVSAFKAPGHARLLQLTQFLLVAMENWARFWFLVLVLLLLCPGGCCSQSWPGVPRRGALMGPGWLGWCLGSSQAEDTRGCVSWWPSLCPLPQAPTDIRCHSL